MNDIDLELLNMLLDDVVEYSQAIVQNSGPLVVLDVRLLQESRDDIIDLFKKVSK